MAGRWIWILLIIGGIIILLLTEKQTHSMFAVTSHFVKDEVEHKPTTSVQRLGRARHLFGLLIRKRCNENDELEGISKLSTFEQACINDTKLYDSSEAICSYDRSLPAKLAGHGNTTERLRSDLRMFISRCSTRCAPYIRSISLLSQLVRESNARSRISFSDNFTVVIHDEAVLHSRETVIDRLLSRRSPPAVYITHSGKDKPRKRLVRGLSCMVDEKPTHGPLAHFVAQVLPYFDADFPCQNYVFTKTPGSSVKNESTFYGLLSKLTIEKRSNIFPEDLYWRADGIGFEHLLFVENSVSNMAHNSANVHRLKEKAWKHLGLPDVASQKTCLFKRSNGRNPGNFDQLRGLLEGIFGDVDILQFNSTVPMETQVRGFYSCWLLVSPHGSHNVNLLFSRPGSYFVELSPPMYKSGMYLDLAEKAGVRFLRTRAYPVDSGDLKRWEHLSTSECMQTELCRRKARSTPYKANLSDLRSNVLPLRRYSMALFK